jgi:hypothetical protein
MGLDPKVIATEIGRSVESFCSIGYIGPAGYAGVLEKMIERSAIPKAVIFMFHPDTFQRSSNWDSQPTFLNQQAAVPAKLFPRSAVDYLQFEWLTRLLYSPLPAAYGLYYGGEASFRSSLRDGHGSVVDPSTGLQVARFEKLKAGPTPPTGKSVDLTINQAYRDALGVLRATLQKLPSHSATYFLISPVPDYMLPSSAAVSRAEREIEIAAALGIKRSHILQTPATMYSAYTSSRTHLNRWGRQIFSKELARQLAPRLVVQLP